jgi:N utilization substance protein A
VKIIVDADQLSLAIGKKGQNARLTSKLTGWNIEIEKEETAADIGFEEKVKRAIEKLAAVPGIEREVAETLVKSGFHSLEGLMAVELNDLKDILGEEKATAVHQAVHAAQPPAAPEGEAPAP